MSTPDGAELDVDVVENADGTFDIYYTAPEPGKYIITIRFGGEHIPNSPFHVVVSNSPAETHTHWVGLVWWITGSLSGGPGGDGLGNCTVCCMLVVAVNNKHINTPN